MTAHDHAWETLPDGRVVCFECEMSKNPAAVALGRLGGLVGGKVKSDAKSESARRNGKLGGRPKKKQPAND